MQSKKEIRRTIKLGWKSLSQEEREAQSLQLWSELKQLPIIAKASDVMLFHALPDEPETQFILNNWDKIKKLWLPAIVGDEIEVRHFDPTSNLAVGAYGISEPTGEASILPHGAVVIVPGVAFDHQGNRLGRGKGYYDRFLANKEVVKIGVALDFQLVDLLPAEPHDIVMDVVITPSEMIDNRKQ